MQAVGAQPEIVPTCLQVNKKRFIGNTYVKVVYSDSQHPFTLSSLSVSRQHPPVRLFVCVFWGCVVGKLHPSLSCSGAQTASLLTLDVYSPRTPHAKNQLSSTFPLLAQLDSTPPLVSPQGQFNLVVVVVAPTTCDMYRITVLRAPEVQLAGPRMETLLVHARALPMYVRRIMIDADITAMISRNGSLGYSSNWQVKEEEEEEEEEEFI